MDIMFTVAIVVTFVGIAFLGLAGISFRIRAITNKKAWNGLTLPLAIIGLPILIAGMALLYYTYPY